MYILSQNTIFSMLGQWMGNMDQNIDQKYLMLVIRFTGFDLMMLAKAYHVQYRPYVALK
jgi:hypothetical protein